MLKDFQIAEELLVFKTGWFLSRRRKARRSTTASKSWCSQLYAVIIDKGLPWAAALAVDPTSSWFSALLSRLGQLLVGYQYETELPGWEWNLKLWRARSRLYRRRFLQGNTNLKALAEIYTMHTFAQISYLKCSMRNCQQFSGRIKSSDFFNYVINEIIFDYDEINPTA